MNWITPNQFSFLSQAEERQWTTRGEKHIESRKRSLPLPESLVTEELSSKKKKLEHPVTPIENKSGISQIVQDMQTLAELSLQSASPAEDLNLPEYSSIHNSYPLLHQSELQNWHLDCVKASELNERKQVHIALLQQCDPESVHNSPNANLASQVGIDINNLEQLPEKHKIDLNQLYDLCFLLKQVNYFPNLFTKLSELLFELNIYKLNPSILLEQTHQLPLEIQKIVREQFTIALIKAIGHEWGLVGKFKVGGKEISTEGSESVNMHAMIAASVEQYFSQPTFAPSHPSSILTFEDKQLIIDSLQSSIFYSNMNPLTPEKALKDYKAGMAVTIGTGWRGHAVEVTLFRGLLFYTNRAERASANKDTSMSIYQIDETKLNIKTFNALFPTPEKDLAEHVDQQVKFFEDPKGGMIQSLGLNEIGSIFKTPLKKGICSWSNMKGGFHALLITLLVEKHRISNPESSLKAALQGMSSLALSIYKDWETFSRIRSLDLLIQLHQHAFNGNLPLALSSWTRLLGQINHKINAKQVIDYLPIYSSLQFKIQTVFKTAPIRLEEVEVYLTNDDDMDQLTYHMTQGKPGDFMVVYLVETNQRVFLYHNSKGDIQAYLISNQIKTLPQLYQTFPDISFPFLGHYLQREFEQELKQAWIQHENSQLETQLMSQKLFFDDKAKALLAARYLEPGQYVMIRKDDKYYQLLVKSHEGSIKQIKIKTKRLLAQEIELSNLNQKFFLDLLPLECRFSSAQEAMEDIKNGPGGSFAVYPHPTIEGQYEYIVQMPNQEFILAGSVLPSQNLLTNLHMITSDPEFMYQILLNLETPKAFPTRAKAWDALADMPAGSYLIYPEEGRGYWCAIRRPNSYFPIILFIDLINDPKAKNLLSYIEGLISQKYYFKI